METSKNSLDYKKWIEESLSNIFERIEKRKTPFLIVIDGKSGSGKDFIINKSIEILNKSDIRTIKTKSKITTRPPRKDELGDPEDSRSGANILSEKKFKEALNLFEYKLFKYSYGINYDEIKTELSNIKNKIIFLPISDFSKMDDGNAYSNFAEFFNNIKKEFPGIDFLNISIIPTFDATEKLEKRVESEQTEIKNRVRQHTFNSIDGVYKRALINKGFIKTLKNHGGNEEELSEIYNLFTIIEDNI